MARGILIGIENVDVISKKTGKQVKFNKYHIITKIEKNGEGSKPNTVTHNDLFDVVVGEEVDVMYDIGFDGRAVCTGMATAEA